MEPTLKDCSRTVSIIIGFSKKLIALLLRCDVVSLGVGPTRPIGNLEKFKRRRRTRRAFARYNPWQRTDLWSAATAEVPDETINPRACQSRVAIPPSLRRPARLMARYFRDRLTATCALSTCRRGKSYGISTRRDHFPPPTTFPRTADLSAQRILPL